MTTSTDLGDFVHPALFYSSPQEYVDCLLPFIGKAVDREQPVLIAVPGPNLAVLREALGAAAADVTMFDMSVAGRNPGRILGSVLTAFAGKHPDKSVQIIGEPIWAARSAAEYPACVQHEALINTTFAHRDLTVVCPYDVSRLPAQWIADARATHPVLWDLTCEQPSADFAPEAVWGHYNQPLPRSATAVVRQVRTTADLTEMRTFAAMYGQWLSVSAELVDDLQLIATELATGSLASAPDCEVGFWADDGHLVCQVRDSGQFGHPLQGRRPYDIDTARGQGLFVVHSVADLVRTHHDSQGTTVQAHLRLNGGC